MVLKASSQGSFLPHKLTGKQWGVVRTEVGIGSVGRSDLLLSGVVKELPKDLNLRTQSCKVLDPLNT